MLHSKSVLRTSCSSPGSIRKESPMNNSVSSNKGEAVAGPGLTHLFTMRAGLGARLDGGDGPLGRRGFNAASGGEFAGARLRGAVVPGSAYWVLVGGDGAWENS